MPIKLPKLPVRQKKYAPMTVQFGGINYSKNYRDGELEDGKNLSTRNYPCLSQTKGKTKLEGYTDATSMMAAGKLLVADGNILKYDGKEIAVVQKGRKEFAVVNTKIVVWPDAIMVDIADPENVKVEPMISCLSGALKNNSNIKFFLAGQNFAHTPSSMTGDCVTVYKDLFYVDGKLVGAGAETVLFNDADGTNPAPGVFKRSIKPGDYVKLYKSNTTYGLCKKTFDATGEEVTFGEEDTADETVYGVVTRVSWSASGAANTLVYWLPVKSTNRFKAFQPNDKVILGGFVENDSYNTEEDKYLTVGLAYEDYPATVATPTYEITVKEKIGVPSNETGEVYIKTKFPELNHICGYNNRLFGTEKGQRIWVSALGIPGEFYDYTGESTDSYAVAVSTDEDFTGCIGYDNTVLFWKADKLHKLMGSIPANYQLYEYTVRGVAPGSHLSQTIINETLFFHAREGICAYTGSVPNIISDNFGQKRFENVVGGTDGEKYYVGMEDTQTGESGTWVFDPATRIWLKEDIAASGFAYLDGILYTAENGNVCKQDDEANVEWSATFCEMTETYMERKSYSRILIRMDLDRGAFCKGEISEDGKPWKTVGTLNGGKTGELLIRPTNCDRFRIRLSGKGKCLVKAMVREFTLGGER